MKTFRIGYSLFLISATFSLLMLFSGTGFATNYTWTGGGNSTLWTDSDNWSPTGVPGAADVATIGNGFTVTTSQPVIIKEVVFGDNCTITFGNNLTLHSPGILTFGNSCTISTSSPISISSQGVITIGAYSSANFQNTITFGGAGSFITGDGADVTLTQPLLFQSTGVLDIGNSSVTTFENTVTMNGTGTTTIRPRAIVTFKNVPTLKEVEIMNRAVVTIENSAHMTDVSVGELATLEFQNTAEMADLFVEDGSRLTFLNTTTATNVTVLGTSYFTVGPQANSWVSFYIQKLFVGIATGPNAGYGVLSLSGQENRSLRIQQRLGLEYAGSKIVHTQDVSNDVQIEPGSECMLYMASVADCYIGNPPSSPGTPSGPNVTTNLLRRSNGLLTDVRFEGDLRIENGLQLDQNKDLYLGENANVVTPYVQPGATNQNYIITGYSPNSASGWVRKQFSHVGQEFFFPVGAIGQSLSPLTLKMETLNSPGSATPWPHVAVRVAFAGTGHPAHSQKSAKSLIWWPVVAHGLECPAASWSGLMWVPKNYVTTTPNNTEFNGDTVYSARYYDNYEFGTFGSGWSMIGTDLAIRYQDYYNGTVWKVPFGSYKHPLNPPFPCTGDFAIGAGTPGSDPIPVELTSFSARYLRNSVQLSWQTATELNNYGFAIERSRDGVRWEEIDFVEGAGNSFSPKTYSYTDHLDPATRNVPQLAYRLRQVDRDGSTEYSNIVFVTLSALPAGVELYAAYPNPFNPSTTISFSLADPCPATVKVYDIYGREVVTLLDNATLDAGIHTVAFNAADLTSGSYVVVLDAAGVHRQQRLVLSK